MTEYAFDNSWQQARKRLAAIEEWLDPGTIRHLSERGVGPGWRCLEVGAGGGSVAAWLCERVGPAGSVVATDLDTRFVDALGHVNLRTLRHNLVTDELPHAEFDLAHARLVIAHLPERAGALDRLVAALRPGGWLVVEEMDFVSMVPDPSSGTAAVALLDRAIAAHHQVVMARGFDPFYGRRAPGDLRARGLVEMGTEGRVSWWIGGSEGATAWRLTFEQLRKDLVATEEITVKELETVVRLLDDPGVSFLSQATIATWGRRPAA